MSKHQPFLDKPDYRILGRCPVCRAQFERRHTAMIERRGEHALFHVDCGRCQSSVLMMVVAGPFGLITTIGMITDIARPDIKRLNLVERVGADDVLALHEFIEHKK